MQTDFSHYYHKIRVAERRIYSDDEVRQLPYIAKSNVHYHEWRCRYYSWMQLKKYLLTKKRTFKILDIGCGNGWMSNELSGIHQSLVVGVENHREEAEQSQRIFSENKRIRFIPGNILEMDLSDEHFDLAILAASAAYFSDIELLINKIQLLLKPGGEIHLIDNPFYERDELEKAKLNSTDYFIKAGVPEMKDFYFHHSWEQLNTFNYIILKHPTRFNSLRKLFGIREFPFAWIKIF